MIKTVPGVARRRNVTILTSTVDAGGTPTTKLRKNLLLAKYDATGKYGLYDPLQNDGRQIPLCVLENETNMIYGGAGDKVASVLEGGSWLDTEILGIDRLALEILAKKGFEFRDSVGTTPPEVGFLSDNGTYQDAGNLVLTAAMSGQRRFATAACDYTLPTCGPGLNYVLGMLANNNLGIAGSANIVAKGNAAANLVRFSTAGQLIGAICCVRSFYTGAAWKWWFHNLTEFTTTVT